ncbi:hypothetical protein Dsin_026634 [Dipteronia sinensis]|uniref:Uncharacterized protein n=1 Tax=Dipteronia sinensis TaxID=43782 RepID=A0AAD9ZYK9_9ROSI|nr:hypothetical protein Dsin_026634 [Dipteronia sinensis]
MLQTLNLSFTMLSQHVTATIVARAPHPSSPIDRRCVLRLPYRLLRARPLGKSVHLDRDSLSTVSQSLSVFPRHRIDLSGPPINQRPQCSIHPLIVDPDPRRPDLGRRRQDGP